MQLAKLDWLPERRMLPPSSELLDDRSLAHSPTRLFCCLYLASTQATSMYQHSSPIIFGCCCSSRPAGGGRAFPGGAGPRAGRGRAAARAGGGRLAALARRLFSRRRPLLRPNHDPLLSQRTGHMQRAYCYSYARLERPRMRRFHEGTGLSVR